MMESYRQNSYLFAGNAPYIEALYDAWLENPASVSENWRDYFSSMQTSPASDGSSRSDTSHAQVLSAYVERGKHSPVRIVASSGNPELARKRIAVQRLISAYRFLGTFRAKLDPLERHPLPEGCRRPEQRDRLHTQRDHAAHERRSAAGQHSL